MKGHHDFRFGGYYMHMADDRTFGAYENAVEALNTTSAALTSLDNFVLGQIQRSRARSTPRASRAARTRRRSASRASSATTATTSSPLYGNDTWSVTDRLKLNLGLRYEYYGPQKKSSPKYDSNFYYSDPSCSVNTSSSPQILDCIARRPGPAVATRARSARCGRPTGTTSPRASASPGTSTATARRRVRGGYGMAYERNFGNVTYNVLFNPPQYLVASIDAPTDVPVLPIYTDNQGPFGGVAGVTKTIPAGSLRHVDQNIVTAYTHFYSAVAPARDRSANTVASIEYTGSTGRNLYDLADLNKRGAALVYEGIGTAGRGRSPQYAAFNTRGNRGQSQYHGVTFGIDSRKLGNTGLQFTAKYTLSQAKDNLSTTFSDGGSRRFAARARFPASTSLRSPSPDCSPSSDWGAAP